MYQVIHKGRIVATTDDLLVALPAGRAAGHGAQVVRADGTLIATTAQPVRGRVYA